MPLNDETRDQITKAIFAGHKIEAIRIYREATAQGLKESKDFIEALTTELREQHPDKVPESKSGCGPAVVLFVGFLGAAFYQWVC